MTSSHFAQRRHVPRRFFGIVVLILVGYGRLSAGAWPQPENHLFISFTLGRYETLSSTTSSGEFVRFSEGGKYIGHRLALYGEYGLSEKFTLLGSFAYAFHEYSSQSFSQSNNGFPDQEIGVLYSLSTYPLAYAISAEYIFPLLYTLDRQPHFSELRRMMRLQDYSHKNICKISPSTKSTSTEEISRTAFISTGFLPTHTSL